MNSDEKMNLVRQMLTAFFGILTALVPSLAVSAQFSLLETAILTAVPALCTLGSIGWSTYVHWNMVKVPEPKKA